MHEAQLHEQNCFITLTYADDQVPPGHSLRYRDFQLFMKRLRRKTKTKIRFYMCGEYGEQFSRPHFHACLFGYDFNDREPITKLASKAELYRSKQLELLWRHGYSTVGAVTFQSAAYVARYVMKKITGDRATSHYTWLDQDGVLHSRTPEFNHMSLKPGIAAAWFDKFKNDVYPSDQVITRGHPSKPPRFYDKRHELDDPQSYQLVKKRRLANLNRKDNTTTRLKAKEAVQQARAALLKRTIT